MDTGDVTIETVEIKSENVAISERHDNSNDGFDVLNICQTCLASGRNSNLKDMTQKHSYGNKYEVYSDMLDYCFGQKFVKMKGSESIYLICEDCIEKLRYVLNFKKQVEFAQEKIKPKVEVSSRSPTSYKEFQESLNEELESIDQEILTLLGNDSSTCVSDESYGDSPEINSSVIDDVSDDRSLKVTRSITNILSPKKTSVPLSYRKKDEKYRELPYTLESDQVQCKICNKLFDTPSNLQFHMPIHFPNFTCDICGNVFANGYQFDMHMKTHTSEKNECQLCQKTFKTSAYMRTHMRAKHGTQGCPYNKCRYCGERFRSFSCKQQHIRKVHGGEVKTYKCKQCEKVLSSSGMRAKHMRKLHITERKHACNICYISFCERSSLNMHMVKHTGIKKFCCSVCKKMFLRRCTLRKHMTVHTREKKHSCYICHQTFTYKSLLKKHMDVHSKKEIVSV